MIMNDTTLGEYKLNQTTLKHSKMKIHVKQRIILTAAHRKTNLKFEIPDIVTLKGYPCGLT